MSLHIIDVSIVYALPNQVWQRLLAMPRGSTPEDLFAAAKLFEAFPELEEVFKLGELQFGVYSLQVDENYLLEQGDRLEVYRPLTADPKEIRRELAKEGKTMSGRG